MLIMFLNIPVNQVITLRQCNRFHLLLKSMDKSYLITLSAGTEEIIQ